MVVKVGRVGTSVKTIALHDNSTVADALSIGGIALSEEEVVFVDGELADMKYVVSDGDLLIVKNNVSVRSTEVVMNIYEAIAQLQKDVEMLKRR